MCILLLKCTPAATQNDDVFWAMAIYLLYQARLPAVNHIFIKFELKLWKRIVTFQMLISTWNFLSHKVYYHFFSLPKQCKNLKCQEYQSVCLNWCYILIWQQTHSACKKKKKEGKLRWRRRDWWTWKEGKHWLWRKEVSSSAFNFSVEH